MKKKATREDLLALEFAARELARIVGPAFDAANAGFAVLGFSFGEGGWSTWVSNARREDMIRYLREMADKLENEEDMPPMRQGEPEA